MDKAIYFDDMGKSHEALIVEIHSNKSAKIKYHTGEFKRLWRMDKINSKFWKELDNITPKEIDEKLVAEQIIEINKDGSKSIRGVKNCYKVISDE